MKTHNAFLVIGVALFFLSLSPARAEVYKWVDKKGTVHYTDDPDQLPEPRRSKELRKLEEKLQKERERREKMRERGIPMPRERIPPARRVPPPPDRIRMDMFELKKKAEKLWKARAKKARERVEKLEEKCEALKKERDQSARSRLTYARPGDQQKYQKAQADHQHCMKELTAARHYLEEGLPEEARRSGVPPGWLR